MGSIVLVHGIFNHVRGVASEAAALHRAAKLRPALAKGLSRIGVEAPEVTMAYYADLLRPDLPEQSQNGEAEPGFEHLTLSERALAAEWLDAAGAQGVEDPQNIGLAPLRQMLGELIDGRGGRFSHAVREKTVRRLERVIVALLRELTAYTTWTGRRQAVRERVVGVLRREMPSVVVAHSLGSLVTYETLHAYSDLNVELLITVGSPLRLPEVLRRLEPAPRGGRGARPTGVQRWVNLADVGDLVAVPPKLAEVFPVDQEETMDTGLGFHGFKGYLANPLTAAALTPYIS